MLGYEFPETVMAIGKDGAVSFLTSVRKAVILKQLADELGTERVRVFGREKERGRAASVMEEFWGSFSGAMTDGSVKVGVLAKDRAEGPMVDEWRAFFEARPNKETVDIASSIGVLLASKDASEQEAARLAAQTGSLLMEAFVATKVLSVVDEGKKMSHAQLSEAIETHVTDQLGRYKSKLPAGLQLEHVDICYPPIIQSGGVFSLKPSAVSNDDQLHGGGAILCSLGIRYRSYCSNLARTLLVNPTKEQEEHLAVLLELQRHLLGQMKPGTRLSAVYSSGVQFLSQLKPGLEANLPANFGFGMGLEFREPDWVINGKSERVVQPGQVYNLAIGLQGLNQTAAKDPKEQNYALLIADTVLVTETGAEMLTSGLSTLKEVSYTLAAKSKRALPAAGGPLTRTRLRNHGPDKEAERRRKEHQRELMAASTKASLARHVAATGGSSKSKGAGQVAVAQSFESYKREAALPRDLCTDWKVVVDRRAETLILPIQGFAVPFHISCVKNVTKGEEGDWVSLRINFHTPGRTFGRKEAAPSAGIESVHPLAEFIRGVVFRSADAARVQETLKSIQELRKAVTDREAARKEMSDLVAQAELSEVSGRRPLRLADVYMRPTLEARRASGDVELHANGLRFRTTLKADQRVDILFANIQHLFFQPCDHESVVILHVHLRHPIMVGKRKTKDIQFYREAIDSLVDETSGRRTRMRFGDEDELAQEAEERKRRAEANAEFKSFAERVVEQSGRTIDVDVPFRDLGFSGIYTKHNVLMQPTTDCLVQLTELPFLVAPLAEVEVAYLERIIFGLKNFDLVLVPKDHGRPVVAINSIPVGSLEAVKDWLDSVDVPFAESKINFNWANVLKTIQEDPVDFYENGGWASLQADEGAEEEDEEDELSSAYEPDDSDAEEEEEEEEDDDEEEEYEDSEEEEESEFSESESDAGSDESEGTDWDELERRAAREDARRDSAMGTTKGAVKGRQAPPPKKARR